MLSPRNVKFRKVQKGRVKGMETSWNRLKKGNIGLQAIDNTRLTARQIEAARRAIVRKIKRLGKLWVCVFPSLPVSGKPAEVRMGKGKGATAYWASPVKMYRMLFEITGVPLELATQALSYGASKLPIKTRIIQQSH